MGLNWAIFHKQKIFENISAKIPENLREKIISSFNDEEIAHR
jgi:hypothetical protein